MNNTAKTAASRIGELLEKVTYWLWAAVAVLSPARRRCPSCSAKGTKALDRKGVVTSLHDCESCGLRFRIPTQTDAENRTFYAGLYNQGFTTAVPAPIELSALLSVGFEGTPRHYGKMIELLKVLSRGERVTVLDYGCSWGYGSWQLASAGYDVTGCEICPRRAEYARSKLGIRIVGVDTIPVGAFDIFFSAHVIEHVTNPRHLVESGIRALRPGGIFVAVTPNGSDEFRKANADAFHRMWGRVHPQLITPLWIEQVAAGRPFILGSLPLNVGRPIAWDNEQTRLGTTSGAELAFAIQNV